jgi:hypothetical protein
MSRSSSLFIGFLAVVVGVSCASQSFAQQGDREGRRGGGRFGGGRGGAGMFGGGMFGGGMNELALIGNPEVQKELGLSEEEKENVAKLSESLQTDRREAMDKLGIDFSTFRDLPEAEREKKTKEMTDAQAKVNEKYQAKLTELLKPEQSKRLKQITVQAAGTMALRNEDVAKSLKLSDDQKKEIDKITDESAQNMRRGFGQGGQEGGDVDFQARMEQMRKANEERDAKLLAVLSEEQRKQLDELKGKPFDVAALRPRGFGGPGGGRGGRGGQPRESTGRQRPPM